MLDFLGVVMLCFFFCRFLLCEKVPGVKCRQPVVDGSNDSTAPSVQGTMLQVGFRGMKFLRSFIGYYIIL